MRSVASPTNPPASGLGGSGEPTERLRRFQGRTAELATLAAQCRTAKDEQDLEAERRASAQLARALARNGILLDQATKAARRALLLGEDDSLREELSAWFAGLGEASLACAALRPLLQRQSGAIAMQTLIRIAVLSARAGDDAGAVDALAGAVQEDLTDPLPLELLGAARYWSEGAVSAENAASYYLQAAHQRQARSESSAAFEDLLRAFEMAPGFEPSASALSAALIARGREAAADEVWREHAALGQAGRETHWGRLERALTCDDLARALGAAADGDFLSVADENISALAAVATDVENLRACRIQELLWQCGLGLVALARLAVAASSERLAAPLRGELWLRAGRAWYAHFSNEAEAVHAFQQALELDPNQREAATELRQLDQGWGSAEPGLGGARTPLLSEHSPAAGWLQAARSGRNADAASALEALARSQTPKIRCVLLTLAAETLDSSGSVDDALRLIKEAVSADPDSCRAVKTFAEFALGAGVGHAEAIERAVSLVLPRAAWCRALAEGYRLSDPQLAMAWAERWLVLCPGSLEAVRGLLELAAAAGEQEKLAEALTWSLSQPQPLSALSSTFAAALSSLATLDPEAGQVLCRRALGVLGPQDEGLRQTLLDISVRQARPALGALVCERWFAVKDETCAERYLELSDLHQAASEWSGWTSALERALKRGAEPRGILERLERSGEPVDPDALFSFLRVRAQALDALGVERTVRVGAERLFARAAWDLASDTEQALLSLRLALGASGEPAPAWLLADLRELAGVELVPYLQRFLEDPALAKQAGPLLSNAASLALQQADYRVALTLAEEALKRDAAHTEVLTVLEQAALKLGDFSALHAAYQVVSQATLGRYGERALHYRAARQFESVAEVARAVQHAIRAFEAVPEDGVTLSLLESLAERGEARPLMVAAMQRVAENSAQPKVRVAWLVRASDATDASEKGSSMRVHLLLNALALGAEQAILVKLHQALTQLSLIAPESRGHFSADFVAMFDAVLPQLDGPLGARSAIEAARICLVHFGDARLALRALVRATTADADVEEFSSLFDYAALLGRPDQGAEVVVLRALELSTSRFASVGSSFLELAARIAEGLGNARDASLLLAASARVAPAEPEADQTAAEMVGNTEPEPARVGSPRLELSQAERKLALLALFRVHAELGEESELARLWARRAEFDSDLRQHLLLALSKCVAVLPGREAEALGLLMGEKADFEGSVSFCQHWLDLARRAANEVAQRAALEALTEVGSAAEKIESALQLARLLEKLHDRPAASQLWRRVHAEEPANVEALRALEREAEAAGDYAELVELLGQRAKVTADMPALSDLRLRRARLLLQKLARAPEALLELTTLLASHAPNSTTVLSVAELIRACNEPTLTAALWLRLAPLTPDFERRLDYVTRACEGFLAHGEVENARHALETLGSTCSEVELLRRSVELERKIADPLSLAASLAKLCQVSTESHKIRAAYLIEATALVARVEDLSLASAYAEHAHDIDSDNPDVHVCLEWLAYLTRGPGTGAVSQQAVLDLRKWDVGVSAEFAALRWFLLAEGVDVVSGGGAGMRELQLAVAQVGESGLVALGLAERFAILEDYDRALLSFDRALEGDLMLVRTRGQVLMRAAQVARGARRFEQALAYLGRARSEEDVRSLALELEARAEREWIAENRRATSRPPEIVRLGGHQPAAELPIPAAPALSTEASALAEGDTLRTPPEASAPASPKASSRPAASERAQHPARGAGGYSMRAPDAIEETIVARAASLARSSDWRATQTPPTSRGPRPSASPAPRPSASPRAGAGSYALGPEAKIADMIMPRDRVASRSAPPVARPSTAPSSRPGANAEAPQKTEPVVEAWRVSSRPPRVVETPVKPSERPSRISSVPPSPRGQSSGRVRAQRRLDPAAIDARNARESELLLALKTGSVGAGKELMRVLEGTSNREQDRAHLAQYMAQILPGDAWALAELHAAALADRDHVLARAVQHVLALTGAAAPVAPPALEGQTEQPAAVQALLFRDAGSAATEAVELAWEGAQHVFHRNAKVYDVGSYDRVSLGALGPVARIFSTVTRALGMVKVPLFHRPSAEPFDARVALISPPSILATGHVDVDSNELLFQLGAALTAALPQYALLFGMPEAEASGVLIALLLAFGPPRAGHQNLAASAQLAEVLWEGIPRRSQRRLQELCQDEDDFSYEQAMVTARLGQYRAGLFACGDLGIAVQQICALEGRSLEGLRLPGGLGTLCRESPAVADLVKLSCSPLYAEMRWRGAEGSVGRLPIE